MSKSYNRKFIDRVENCKNVDPSVEKYYVVLRSNRRVSDTNHISYEAAQAEQFYWSGILNSHPDGTRMEIYTAKNPNYRS